MFTYLELNIELEFDTPEKKLDRLFKKNINNIDKFLQKAPYIMPNHYHLVIYFVQKKDLYISLKKDNEGICHILIYFKKNKKGSNDRKKVVKFLESIKYKKLNRYNRFVKNYIKRYEPIEDTKNDWIGLNIYFHRNKSKLANITIKSLNTFNKKSVENNFIFVTHVVYDEKKEKK